MLTRCVLVAALCLGTKVRADPILALPPVGRGSLIHAGAGDRSAAAAGSTDPARLPGQGGRSELGFVAEMSALETLDAEAATFFPGAGPVDRGESELARMRVGLVGWSGCQPLGFAVRADVAEALRLEDEDLETAPLAAAGALVDDLYAAWTPRPWAQLWVGRQPVPFSHFRHAELALATGGAVPFVVDRIAPERRWGAAFHGDLGALAYAIGGYADGGAVELEPARQEDLPGGAVPALPDPSSGGRAALAAHLEWTPRAPIGPGSLASPSADPWFPVPRVSAGAGALVRLREPELGNRVDLSLSGNGKLRGLSALVELILSIDGGEVALAAASEAGLLATDRLHLFARADYDIEIGWWTAGGGAAWFVTADRWNKLSLFAWARRQRDGEAAEGDGVVLELQASL